MRGTILKKFAQCYRDSVASLEFKMIEWTNQLLVSRTTPTKLEQITRKSNQISVMTGIKQEKFLRNS